MRAIIKGREPRSLTEHRCQPHADYDNYPDKDDLRRHLVAEQRGLCCYCMGRIDVDHMKIEHWHCQDHYPEEQLSYSNLLGACLGHQGQPKREQHCDTYKLNAHLSRNPADPSHQVERGLRYLGDGTIRAEDPGFDAELNGPGTPGEPPAGQRERWVLNLNVAFLRNNRKAVLDALVKSFAGTKGPLPRAVIERKLREWNGDDGQETLREYCQVVVYWLHKRLDRA